MPMSVEIRMECVQHPQDYFYSAVGTTSGPYHSSGSLSLDLSEASFEIVVVLLSGAWSHHKLWCYGAVQCADCTKCTCLLRIQGIPLQ